MYLPTNSFMLTDAHAHLNDKAFENPTFFSEFSQNGIGIIVNGAWDVDSSIKAMELAEKYPDFYFTAGIHPHNAKDAKGGDFDAIIKLAEHEKCVAIGEIGLDYHYDFSPRDMQKDFFQKQIDLAYSLKLPVVLHLRECYQDANDIILANKDKLTNGVLLHCYSGSMELARDVYNKLGFYYSFGGAITFKNAKKGDTLRVIPRDRLMLETDCPYMTPVPKRGQTNSPLNLNLICDKMAEELDLTSREVEELTENNLKRFYNIRR